MSADKLKAWLDIWDLKPAQGAVVLRYSKSKISEILSPDVQKKLPPYIEAHIDTFALLSKEQGDKLIQNALNKK